MLNTGVSVSRILAVGLAVALSLGVAVYLEVEHPPAAATTLMFALGFMPSLRDLGVLMLAVSFVVARATAINRRVGCLYSLWDLDPTWWRNIVYRHLGQLVDLGTGSALNNILGVKFTGLLGALVWKVVYFYELGYNLNRARVLVDRTIDLFARADISRILEE